MLYLRGFLGQFCHLEICFLSTPRQMPQTITNIPRCLPQILTLPKFWYHLAHSFSHKNVPFDFERAFWEAEGALPKPKGPFFRENEAQEMTPKLLALAKVCSVLGNIRDVSWHLSKRGSELEKRWTFSFLDKNGAHKNKACFKEKQIILGSVEERDTNLTKPLRETRLEPCQKHFQKH